MAIKLATTDHQRTPGSRSLPQRKHTCSPHQQVWGYPKSMHIKLTNGIIAALSHPQGKSVNDGIPKELCSMTTSQLMLQFKKLWDLHQEP